MLCIDNASIVLVWPIRSIDVARFNIRVGDFVEVFAAAPFAKTSFSADLIAWRDADPFFLSFFLSSFLPFFLSFFLSLFLY